MVVFLGGEKEKQFMFFEKMVFFLGLDQPLCLKEKHFPKEHTTMFLGEHKHFLRNMAVFFWNMVS
jgi:hypothetical protein